MSELIRWQRLTRFNFQAAGLCKIYDLCPEGSPLRRFATQTLHWVIAERQSEQMREIVTQEDLFSALIKYPDLLRDYLEAARSHPSREPVMNPVASVAVCIFHHHGEGETCKAPATASN